MIRSVQLRELFAVNAEAAMNARNLALCRFRILAAPEILVRRRVKPLHAELLRIRAVVTLDEDHTFSTRRWRCLHRLRCIGRQGTWWRRRVLRCGGAARRSCDAASPFLRCER